MKIFTTLLFLAITTIAFSQTLTHGPIVGAVTDSSCRVFVRTSAATSFTVDISTTYAFTSIAATATGSTNGAADNVGTVTITGLSPYQAYFVRVSISGSQVGDITSFETFQASNMLHKQVFLTGSALTDLNSTDSSLFAHALGERAKGFIMMGDWGNPDPNGDFDVYFSTPPNSWAKTYSNIQTLYKQRYSSVNSGSFWKTLALDYVYDDHDYMNKYAGKTQVLGYHINPFNGVLGAPENWDMPALARTNSIQAYTEYFPSYPLVNSSEGIYHSFRSGNAEFFVLDTRSMRGPELLNVNKVSNQWVYNIGWSQTSFLGDNQMNWLKNGLQNSSATWKFIISSVPFNLGNRFPFDTLIKIGDGNSPYWHPFVAGAVALPGKGFAATVPFSDTWTGFQPEQDSLLSFIFGHNIQNVFVVSGGTRTVGMDDGANSGLPELMTDNLNAANSQDALLIQNFMHFNIWDLGGSGLCDSTNFSNVYGRISIFDNDSIRLSAIDRYGDEVVGATFMRNTPYKYNPNYSPNHLPTASNDAANVNENDNVQISVLSNDADIDNDQLYSNIKTNPNHGTVVVNNDNTITYTPDANYVGADTFYYKACDHINATCQNCATAMVTVNVVQFNAVNNLQQTASVKVYPNPADNILFVEASNDNEGLKFELSNLLGEKVISENVIGKTTVNTSALASGTYFYRIFSSSNELQGFGKVSINK